MWNSTVIVVARLNTLAGLADMSHMVQPPLRKSGHEKVYQNDYHRNACVILVLHFFTTYCSDC